MPTTYKVQGEILGQGFDLYVENLGGFSTSVAYCCGTCGEVWGRRESLGHEWSFRVVGCHQHPGYFPPSFWPIDDREARKLPPAVLAREVEIHALWALKGAVTMTPQLEEQIRMWRQKAIDKTMSEADMIEVVKHLRAGRVAAQMASSASKVKKAKAAGPVINADDLLNEMMDGSV